LRAWKKFQLNRDLTSTIGSSVMLFNARAKLETFPCFLNEKL
jgi:hypothetical protein